MLALLLQTAIAAPLATEFSVCAEEGLTERCRKQVQRYTKWHPEEHDVATYRLAVSLLAYGDTEGAARVADVLVPDPEAPSAWSWGAANIWMESGDYAQAAAAYESVLNHPGCWWGFYEDAVTFSTMARTKALEEQGETPVTMVLDEGT